MTRVLPAQVILGALAAGLCAANVVRPGGTALALLAVPLTLLFKALLVEADPDARWALPIISGKPAEAG